MVHHAGHSHVPKGDRMPLITWNPSYSVKIGEIDSQHQKLIAMMNEMNDAMAKGKGKEVLGPIIDGMISYTKAHFSKEEGLFDKYDYPDAPAHKEQHVAFVKKVTEFRENYLKNQLSLTINVMNFLGDWWVNHICGTDRKYSDFFNKLGVK
jgi:hemerythrin